MLWRSRRLWTIWGVLVFAAPVGAEPAGDRLHAESVYALLDLVQTIVEENPGFENIRSELKELGEPDFNRRLSELTARNATNPDIAAGIDAFLETEARTIYFRRFRNVTPDHFRRVLLSLPYVRIDSPGDIATPLYELTDNLDEVRFRLDALVTQTDLHRCSREAERWLPEGNYVTPSIYVIYDNNAGSYTAEGKAFYNLYAGEGASDIGKANGQAIMTHEIHHVLAQPYFLSAKRRHDRWERGRMDMIVRSMVSEGTAIHCNPPTGFKKAVYENPGTLKSLIAEFNQEFLALLNGEVSEESFREWYGFTFHGLPRKLLEEFVSRETGKDGNAAEMVRTNMSHRPDLVHALGWWMVSRISGAGSRPEAVQELVQNPYNLLSRYNQTVQGGDNALRIDPAIVAAYAEK